MPEGDSIRRDAVKLAPLVGAVIEKVTTQGLERDLVGRTITAATPYGKHMTVALDDGTELRIHRGIRGGFGVFPRAVAEQRLARMSPGRASLVLTTPNAICIWRDAKTVEFTHRRSIHRGAAVAALGPDVMAADFDPAAAAERCMQQPSRNICDALLDQRLTAGIGNIFKNEALFVVGVDPRRTVGSLSKEQITAMYADAHQRMQKPRGDKLVYGRTHQTCRVCGTPIQIQSLGETPRWTWRCPSCQA